MSAGTEPTQTDLLPRPVKVSNMPYDILMARGILSGHIRIFLEAETSSAVPSDPDWVDVAQFDQVTFDTASTLTVVSTDDNDISAGSGAQNVEVWGAAPGLVEDSADPSRAPYQGNLIPMNGTAGRVSTKSFEGAIHGARVSSSGGTTNLGTITVSVTGGDDLLVIPPGRSTSRQSRVAVPLGWSAYIRRIQPFWEGSDPARWELRRLNYFGQEMGTEFEGRASDPTPVTLPPGGLRIPPGSIFWFRGQRGAGPPSNVIQMHAFIDIVRDA